MKRSLLVLKDINYAASIGSATKNTALTPDMLADGALGIYGISPTTNKHVLITDASTGTGLLQAAVNAVDEVNLYVGTSIPNKPIKTGVVSIPNLKVKASGYIAPVKQVYSVGYNTATASGSMNFPSVILAHDEGIIKIIDKFQTDEILRTGDTYSGYASADSDSEYNILASLVANINKDPYSKVSVDIVGAGTGVAFVAGNQFTGSGTAQIAATKGSRNIVVSATSLTAWNASVGTQVYVGGSLYKITSVGTPAGNAVTITLDRAYKGATFTATNVSTTSGATVATVTETGLRFTDSSFDMANNIITMGIFSSATSAVVTEAVFGSGTPSHLIEKEKLTWDRVDRIDRRLSLPTSQIASSGSYDQYNLIVRNEYRDKAGTGSLKTAQAEIIIATPTGIADTAGKNQSDLEDILVAFGIPFTSVVG